MLPQPGVPLVDIGAWESGDGAARTRIAAEVDAACRDWGFLVVEGHGISTALIETMVRETADFFALPVATKEGYLTDARDRRGYQRYATGANAHSRGELSPPDLRESLLEVGADSIDGVFYTHDHADHTHGIDDLRVYALNTQARLPVYFDASTGALITAKFEYCFRNSHSGAYPAILKPHEIQALQPVTLGGKGGLVTLTPFAQTHGEIVSLGFRVGSLAYSPDISGVPEASLPMLRDLDVWIVDALRPAPHPSHFSLSEALDWIERLKPKRAILTHLHVDLDYDALKRKLPPHVEPAYDGMVVPLEV